MGDLPSPPSSLPAPSSSANASSSSVKRVRTYSRLQSNVQPIKRVRPSSPVRSVGHSSDMIPSDDFSSSPPSTINIELPLCGSQLKDGLSSTRPRDWAPSSSPDSERDSELISETTSKPRAETDSSTFEPEMPKKKQDTQGQMTIQSFFRPVSMSSGSSRFGLEPKAKLNQPLLSTSSPTYTSKSTSTKPSAHLQQTLICPAPRVKTCALCHMTYQPLSPSDESTHRVHHRRVLEGLEWDDADRFKSSAQGKGKGRGGVNDEECWKVIQEDVEFSNGKRRGKGRVVVVFGRGQGKVGKKTKALHTLIDSTLSSPPLPDHVLDQTKTFLFLATPISSSSSASKLGYSTSLGARSSSGIGSDTKKEVVLGALVVQQIKIAYRVLDRKETLIRREVQDKNDVELEGKCKMIVVEPDRNDDGTDERDGGVFCDPTPLPTQLGIHRVHTAHSARRLGIASTLLDIACRHTIFGMQVTSADDVAFSQPTRSGRALMERWGHGSVRVFIEDE